MLYCPYCKTVKTRVVDSRENKNYIRRRRECPQCCKRFSTYEYLEGKTVLSKEEEEIFSIYKELFPKEKILVDAFIERFNEVKRTPISKLMCWAIHGRNFETK